MISLWRIAVRTAFGIGLLGAAAAAGLYLLASFSLPKHLGNERVAGLDARVEVIRDAHAVPRIFAKTRHDVFFAMGYVHAMDRLWQMELSRRLAQGRLAELFGDRALATDRFMRSLDLAGHAERSRAALSAEAQKALAAYADGVNARLEAIRSQGLGRGAPELFVFWSEVEPWRAADSLAVLKTMAFKISLPALSKEVKRGRFLLALSPDDLRDLFPEYPGQGILALPPAPLSVERPKRDAPERRRDLPLIGDLDEPGGGGSNAWAIDGRHSASQSPLLASDPHLDLTAPSIWHPIQISGPGLSAIGGSIPGIPAIVTGRNERIAWGITAAQVDDLDVFIERVNPDDPTRYETAQGWRAFKTRTERIRSRSGSVEEYTVRGTRHGPVIPSGIASLYSVTPRDHVPSIAWTALTDDDTSYEALLRLNRANSVTEALRAATAHVAPALNLVAADSRIVGMALAGRVPLRRLTGKFQGRVPTPGWTESSDWIGEVPESAKPRIINPPSGRVANANNRVGDGEFPRHLSFDWAPPYRLDRIRKLLDSRAAHSLDSFQSMQIDAVSEMARTLAPLIGASIWDRDDDGSEHGLRSEALEMLKAWNGSMSEHHPEPLIFVAWMDALTEGLTADELGELSASFRGPRPLFIERVFRGVDGAERWCDDRNTETAEDCSDIAAHALDTVLSRLSETYGEQLRDWRWGAAHRAVHRHTTLGRIDLELFGTNLPLSRLFNIDHEVSGSDYTLNRASATHVGADPYVSVHGAGYRGVYDLADLDRSRFIVSTGVSGHFLSPHYDDLAALWRSGDLVPMSMARKDIEPGSLGTLTLEPPQSGGAPILP